jgi:hypothetical protein
MSRYQPDPKVQALAAEILNFRMPSGESYEELLRDEYPTDAAEMAQDNRRQDNLRRMLEQGPKIAKRLVELRDGHRPSRSMKDALIMAQAIAANEEERFRENAEDHQKDILNVLAPCPRLPQEREKIDDEISIDHGESIPEKSFAEILRERGISPAKYAAGRSTERDEALEDQDAHRQLRGLISNLMLELGMDLGRQH